MEKDRSGVTEQYWQKVEQARRHFQVAIISFCRDIVLTN